MLNPLKYRRNRKFRSSMDNAKQWVALEKRIKTLEAEILYLKGNTNMQSQKAENAGKSIPELKTEEGLVLNPDVESLLAMLDELSADFDRFLKLVNSYGLTGPLLREVKALMVERKERYETAEQVQEAPYPPSDAPATVGQAPADDEVSAADKEA